MSAYTTPVLDTQTAGSIVSWVLPTLNLTDTLAELRIANTDTLRWVAAYALGETALSAVDAAYAATAELTRSALIMRIVNVWARVA